MSEFTREFLLELMKEVSDDVPDRLEFAVLNSDLTDVLLWITSMMDNYQQMILHDMDVHRDRLEEIDRRILRNDDDVVQLWDLRSQCIRIQALLDEKLDQIARLIEVVRIMNDPDSVVN